MGLFDKVLKQGEKFIKDVASEENKEKASAFFNKVKDTVSEKAAEIASEENKEKASAFFHKVKDTVSEKAAELTSEENKEKVSSFFSNLKEQASEWKENIRREEEKEEAYYNPTEEEEAKSCRDKIMEVLASDFPQYEVKEDVSPVTFGGEGRFMNYSIVVYEEGKAKLVMMLIGKTTTAHREYRWSKEAAQKAGVPFINFVKHYPNTYAYIRDRLHKYL
ncbi:MAG: hypothetical protein IIY44_06640 [Erysipelotrichales bacterium]|nr:hypothetical protein [Erysipelotrichales bacterium]